MLFKLTEALSLSFSFSPGKAQQTPFPGELWEFTGPMPQGLSNPGMGFAKASAVTRGTISAVSLLGRKLLVAAFCLSELSIACYSRTVAVHYKFILRDHMLKASCGSLEHPGRKMFMG